MGVWQNDPAGSTMASQSDLTFHVPNHTTPGAHLICCRRLELGRNFHSGIWRTTDLKRLFLTPPLPGFRDMPKTVYHILPVFPISFYPALFRRQATLLAPSRCFQAKGVTASDGSACCGKDSASNTARHIYPTGKCRLCSRPF